MVSPYPITVARERAHFDWSDLHCMSTPSTEGRIRPPQGNSPRSSWGSDQKKEDYWAKAKMHKLAGSYNNLIRHSKPRVRFGSTPLKAWSCGSIRDETYDFRLHLASFSSLAPFPSPFSCQSFTPATHTLLMQILQPTVDTLWLNFHRWVSVFKSTPYCHWNNRMLKPL